MSIVDRDGGWGCQIMNPEISCLPYISEVELLFGVRFGFVYGIFLMGVFSQGICLAQLRSSAFSVHPAHHTKCTKNTRKHEKEKDWLGGMHDSTLPRPPTPKITNSQTFGLLG